MLPPLAIGTVLQNRYRVLSTIGQGGFGRTYLAVDQGRFDERCVIKELIPAQDDAYVVEKSKELFQREAAVLYQIQHPQIPQFRANFEQDQRLYLIQDYVEGKTYQTLLQERLQGNPYGGMNSSVVGFSEAEAMQLMQQLLPVLGYIHSKGIIHRDISPGNLIRRDRDQLPILIDFGVVKDVATRVQPSYVDRATTVGKIGYAPMEQIQTGQAYPNSDLYSLAVTTIVLMTGREPQQLFDDRTMTWRWQTLVSVSPRLADILNRMLNYKPGDRFQTAQEVAQALQQIAPNAQAYPRTQAPNQFPASPYGGGKNPPPTQAATVAIGRPPEPTAYATGSTTRYSQTDDDSERTLLDNPLAIGAIGAGIALAAGFGSLVAVDYLRNRPTPTPVPTPSIVLTPNPSPSPSPTVSPSPSPVTINQPLELELNQTQQIEGNLRSNEVLNYQVTAKQGQDLKITLASDAALMSILGPNGAVVDPTSADTRAWQGILAEDGQYTVQLKLLPGRPRSQFKLSLTLTGEKPSPSPSPSPSSFPSPDTPPAAGLQIRRINVIKGGDSVEVADRATPNTTLRYQVSVKQGDILDAIVISGLVTITVRYPDGTAVENAGGLVNWQGEATLTGDYQIDVIAIEPTNFVLQVGVR